MYSGKTVSVFHSVWSSFVSDMIEIVKNLEKKEENKGIIPTISRLREIIWELPSSRWIDKYKCT